MSTAKEDDLKPPIQALYCVRDDFAGKVTQAIDAFAAIIVVNVTVGFADDNTPSPTHYCASAAKPGDSALL